MPLDFSIDTVIELEDGTRKTETVQASVLQHPSEITLKEWGGYFERLEKQPDWFKQFHNTTTEQEKKELQAEWSAEQWAKSYLILARLCLTYVKGATLNDLLEMPMGSAGSQGVDSLLGLFLLTINNVYGYQPQSRAFFEHKGRKFKAFTPLKVAGQEMPGGDMSVRDAINALQLEHSWQNHTDGGANQFNINVGVVTALCREVIDGKVEKPPVGGSAYLQWSFERQAFFEDLPLDIALDVVFFSVGFRALSRNIPLSVSCLLQASQAA